jgi:hypothetical protein
LIFNFSLGRKGILLGAGAKLGHQTRQNKLKKILQILKKNNNQTLGKQYKFDFFSRT